MGKGKKDKNTSVDSKKRKAKASKFRTIGKYFLIVLLIGGQAFLSYYIISNNYEAIYSYIDGFFPPESGEYQLEQIIVNPANTNGKRYFLVKLSLELVKKEEVMLIKENKSKIRNDLIKYLSARSVSELQGIEGKEELRFELVQIINQAIGKRSVRNLYYSKYVMQ
ncbi:flagellar basal body-associated FliL family protein [Fodinibius halophilus]|uniref:Flagellar protein FliL n=1 Tax=Fodinibius halophilus TaxID=1736908 RepID=A0A6M1T411_9BACT|nr:flagellar basal body-associated FliL family protein [Fodinibius halophilus]NGP87393.1 flagellar basal body-associated FliL family protein [Fodinibius halophilus]